MMPNPLERSEVRCTYNIRDPSSNAAHSESLTPMTPENLYVVKRTFQSPSHVTEPIFDIALPATFSDLETAKLAAKNVLFDEGYEKYFFATYDINDGKGLWSRGDGVIVHATGASGEVLKVEIDTVANSAGLGSDAHGKVLPPLYHVLQTIIDYDKDRSGFQRKSIVEGSYADLEVARSQALKVLLDESVTKDSFVDYNEYADGSEGPFGRNVVVHAVKEGGQNILVSVVHGQ